MEPWRLVPLLFSSCGGNWVLQRQITFCFLGTVPSPSFVYDKMHAVFYIIRFLLSQADSLMLKMTRKYQVFKCPSLPGDKGIPLTLRKFLFCSCGRLFFFFPLTDEEFSHYFPRGNLIFSPRCRTVRSTVRPLHLDLPPPSPDRGRVR